MSAALSAADLYGRTRIFILGLALFSAASLVGGLASTPGMLITARAIQGLGAAILTPATLTVRGKSLTSRKMTVSSPRRDCPLTRTCRTSIRRAGPR